MTRLFDLLTTLALIGFFAASGVILALYLTEGPPPVVSSR